jgi:hypothetical protein
MNKIDSYLNELYIKEEINLPNLDVKKFASKFKSVVNVNDPKGSVKNIMKIAPPGIKPSMIQGINTYISSKYDKFDSLKDKATKIVKNSVEGVSPKMADIAGSYLAISSMFAKKAQSNMTHEANLTLNIQEFMGKVQKFGEDYEEEAEKKNRKIRPSDYADLSVAWVIVVMSTGLAIGISTGVYIALKIVAMAFAATLAGFMSVISWGIVIILFTLICSFIASKTGLG